MSRKTLDFFADLYRFPKCGKHKQGAFRPLVCYAQDLAATIAAVVTLGFAAAAAAIKAAAAMDPNDYDGDDYNDPEGLITTTEQTAATTVITTITSVHKSYLLHRFLTPYYSTAWKLCATKTKNPARIRARFFLQIFLSLL